MKALVTGGGGFLGQAIIRALLERGGKVRSFSRHAHRPLCDLGVEQCQGDLADAAALSKAVAGCDIVFHVAAKPGIWGPYREYYRTNVIGTENVVAACRQHSVPRLIYTSSPSVIFNGRDLNGVNESVPYPARFEAPYPETKAKAEQCVRNANSPTLATLSLRPHLIWGPGDHHVLPRLAARARAGRLRRIGSQRKLIDTTFIDNAATAHLLAAERLRPGASIAGKVYFISQGEPRETWEMVNALLTASGVAPVQRSVPVPAALALAWFLELTHRLTGNRNEPRLTRFVVREMCAAHWFDISAARRDLDYAPKISITEGLDRLQAFYRAGKAGLGKAAKPLQESA
jgi:nucleoside-diphosphate-sugar epimerase